MWADASQSRCYAIFGAHRFLDLANLSGRVDLDFATATDFIYWPFNGEFWRDELGYYHYTEQGSCK